MTVGENRDGITQPTDRSGDAQVADAPAGEGPADDEAAELERMRSERDAAVAALDKHGRRVRRRARLRRSFVGFLVVIFSLLLPITATVGWAHNLVLNTNGYVRTVGPLASNPAVTSAVSIELTNEIFTSLDAQSQIAGALPPRAAFLAGPITNGVKGYVQTGVNNALNTPQFQAIWVGANRFAHQELVNVLRGHSKALTTTNGQVVLDLVPLLNAALQQISPFVSGIVGKPINLPDVTSQQIPAAACQRISSALGRPLPSTCGQIPLFPADKLSQAQRLVRVFDRITVLLIVLTPVVAVLALWISRRRRRTVLQLTSGGVLGLVVFRRAIIWLENSLIKTGKPQNKAARQAIVHQLTHGFFTLTFWFILGLVIVFALGLLTGPYAWARSMRAYIATGARNVGELALATVDRARDERTVGWIKQHLGTLRLAGVALAILLLIVVPVSFIGFLIIAALLVAYELWLRRMQTLHAATPVGEGGAPPLDLTDSGGPPSTSEPVNAGEKAAAEQTASAARPSSESDLLP